jgi:hypothetical protein
MMNLSECLLGKVERATDLPPDWMQPCLGPNGSATHLVESTLEALQPNAQVSVPLELGYTLQVPLLMLLQAEEGSWQVNQAAVDRVMRTVRDNPRPLVLYLFATHFSTNAPIEPVLFQDMANVAQTAKGPLPLDNYYGMPLYPWSVARTDNSITQYRVKVIKALAGSICKLPSGVRDRIKGITLLGEVHQLFPNFESGMGFGGAYQVSDYSPPSIVGFRGHLRARYSTIQELNRGLGSDYKSFEDIDPPSKNIRSEPLKRYQEHIDPFAAGIIPFSGWSHTSGPSGSRQTVKIFLDGAHLADAPVHLGRQDVLAAHPEFKTADLGWRYDLDYRSLQKGIHRVDLALSLPGEPLVHLGTRSISIMDRTQSSPVLVASASLPIMQPQGAATTAYSDEPRDGADYYYNPLVREWQAYRELQVVNYLQYFNRTIAQSCLSDTPRYMHQIVPQFNPGWDSSKYAVDASLQPQAGMRLGVSLYGETSYGSSFVDWSARGDRSSYGITEFHPLKAMDTQQLADVLSQHRENGARFLSFFLETRWKEKSIPPMPNLFAFDPDNPKFGSDALFHSMRWLLSGQSLSAHGSSTVGNQ